MFTSPSFAQWPATKVVSIFPAGGKAGTEFDVTIRGNDLDDADRLIFSHSGITAKQKISEATEFHAAAVIANQFQVKIDGNVPPGLYEARAVGRFGASNPRLFAVGNLPELTDDNSNKEFENAREIAPPLTVNGAIDGGSRDYFKLALKQNERIIIDCAAERIDSRMDATVIVYDDNGAELARNRDAVGSDAVLDFIAPADGTYVIGLYDFLYRGGNDYGYRLSVHSAPFVDFVFPPVGQPGRSQYTLYGRNLPGGKPDMQVTTDDGTVLESVSVEIDLPANDLSRQQIGSGAVVPLHTTLVDTFEYQFDSPQGKSNHVPIGYALAPVAVEAEPNDSPNSATKVTVPCEVAGQFYPANDLDWIEFEAKQGEVYWIDVISHRLGGDTDPQFRLQRVTKNANGEEQVSEITNVDDPADRNNRYGQDYDTSTDDPVYRFQAPQDGTYRVAVRDQFNTTGDDARRIYRLAIREQQHDFRLIAIPAPDGPINNNVVNLTSTVLRNGGTAMVEVRAERQDGFEGEIEITAEGLPGGVTCAGATIAGPHNTGTLVFTAAENAGAWAGPVRIVGRAKIGDREVIRNAWTGYPVWETSNRQVDPPQFRASHDLVLAVLDKETDVALVETEGQMWETSRGGKLEIPFKVTRREGFNGDLNLAPVATPNEIKPSNLSIKGNQGDGKLQLQINNGNAKPGVYTFCLRGDVKFKYKRNQDAVKQAEQEQKRLEELVKQFQQQVQQRAADRSKAADDAKAAAEQAFREAEAKLKTAQQLKQKADQELKNVQNANKEADRTVTVYSQPVKLRVVESPIDLTVNQSVTVKQGEKIEIPVTVARNYGFADQVQIIFENSGVGGISARNFNIPNNQSEGKLEVNVAQSAPAGEHSVVVRGRVSFNGVGNIDSTQQISLKIEQVNP